MMKNTISHRINRKNKDVGLHNQPIKEGTEDEKFTFRKLTPISDASISAYEEALNYAFDYNNKDIQNIAITGIFGSGKSSIIRTYERIHNMRFAYVSFAHFENVQNEEGEEILEKKIINQLIQQIPDNLISETAFKTKKEFNKGQAVITAVLFAIAVILGEILFRNDSILINVAEVGDSAFRIPCTVYGFCVGICAFSITLSILSYRIIKWISTNHMISRISFKGTGMDIVDADDKSYFNKHIDEILYVLEKITSSKGEERFDGIVIEDLDRFSSDVDTKIFEKLRELCIQGNDRLERIRGKDHFPLRFIYLINDSVFSSKDRTKFFDFIIPVIPYVDSLNSYSRIRGCLEETGYYKELDDRFLRGVSLYFDDYRLIINIINEFHIYAQILSKTEHDYNILLAIIVYKNFFPKDFVKLQLHSGYVNYIFEKRSELIEKKKESLKNRISVLNSELAAIKTESLLSETELNTIDEARKRDSYMRVFQDMHYDEWKRDVYPIRVKAIKDRQSNREAEIREEVAHIQSDIIHLNNRRLYELIDQEDEAYVFDYQLFLEKEEKQSGDYTRYDLENNVNNEHYAVIKYLIMNGYLDDASYRDYMACFEDSSITVADKNFLSGIFNCTGKDFTYRLDKPSIVYEYIPVDIFIEPATRNFDLIDYIFRNEKTESIENFLYQLQENKDFCFVAQYLRYTTNYEEFIGCICGEWDNFLEMAISVDNTDMMTKEKQSVVLTALCVCSKEIIDLQNKSGVLVKYLSEELSGVVCEEDKVECIIDKMICLGVNIQEIDSQIASESLRIAVINNRLYQLTYENLYSILKKNAQYSDDDIKRRFISSLMNCKIGAVYEYVNDHLAEVIDLVIHTVESQVDYEEIVLSLAESGIEDSLIESYLSNSETIVHNLDRIDTKFWGTLADKHTFLENQSNVITYFEKKGLDPHLINYINHAQIGTTLVFKIESELVMPFWLEAYKCVDFDNGAYLSIAEEIGSIISSFGIPNLGEDKCRILMNLKLIEMDVVSINTFRTYYPSLVRDFICTAVDKYVSLARGSMYILDEVIDLLDDDRVEDDMKIELLHRTNESISVLNRNISDDIFLDIINNCFEESDLPTLFQLYDTYNESRREAIYDLLIRYRNILPDTALVCSKNLLLLYFSDNTIPLSDKAGILDILLKDQSEYSYVSELLNAAGEEMIAKLFSRERSRMSTVNNDRDHKRLLSVLKDNGIIANYSEEDDGKALRIKRC